VPGAFVQPGRHRDPPRHAGPRDRHVLQPLLDHRQHLVAAVIRLDELRVGLDVGAQPVGVLRQPEEEVLLRQRLHRLLVHRAQLALEQVLGLVERLAGHAVEPLVLGQVDVAGRVAAPEDLLHRRLVAVLGGAHVAVVADVQRVPAGAEAGRQLVGEDLRVDAPRLRLARDLHAVLVGAGEEEGVVAALAVIARQAVGDQLLVGVAEVRAGVDVIDRGGDVEAASHGVSRPVLGGGPGRSDARPGSVCRGHYHGGGGRYFGVSGEAPAPPRRAAITP